MSASGVRAIDHLVLPVGELETARSRYTSLGFTVAPVGSHPFGTENANIFFSDGTFLEPLAVAVERAYEVAVANGNSFVRNDEAAREVLGTDCFSHVVLKTADAESDDRGFSELGISGGSMVRFSRAFRTNDGLQEEAEFLLAFASRGSAPDGCFFSCETIKAPSLDRSALLKHANGATRLKKIICCMRQPVDSRIFVQGLVGGVATSRSPQEICYPLPNAMLSVLTPQAIDHSLGVPVEDPGLELRHIGFVVEVMNLAESRRILDHNDIGFGIVGARLVVCQAPGQGALIVFEDIS